jgi:hypothetical protein
MRLTRDQTVVEPQHAEALFKKPRISLRVPLDLHFVPIAVRLDDQPVAKTDEVHHEGPDRDLATEL